MNRKIFYGAPFYTMDGSRNVVQAVVVSSGRFEFVTANPNEANNLYPDAELVELSEGCVIPGFVDAHLHLKEYSILFKEFDLTAAERIEDILEGVQSALSDKKKDEWLWASGVPRHLLNALTKQDIDPLSPHNPVALFSSDLRVSLANSSALSKSGIEESRRDPLGGKIGRDQSEQPNGLLYDRAIELLRKALPEERARMVDAAVEKSLGKMLSYGLTTVCDCSSQMGSESLRTLMKLLWKGRLKPRVVVMFGERDALRLGEIGFSSNFGDEHLRMGGFSVIIDGSFSSLTAYMSDGYMGGSSNGMLLMDEEELYTLMKSHFSHYFWGSVQCVGDGASEVALKVFNRLGSEVGVPRLLKRIDIAAALKDSDINEIARGNVIPVMVPGQIVTERERAIKALGSDSRLLFRFRSLINSGAHIAFASDAPYSSLNPMDGIYSAVERKEWGEGPELRFYPKESISIADAAYAYTMGGARACGVDSEVGSIEKGKHADFVHLSNDIFTDDSAVLKKTRVLNVFVSGEPV
ncbi:MAG: hypothetical protein AMS17_17285 [Spirochaetes bacterium DG_61]|nr:MAG: hypothetical protein AMS17_17285 [Spirochaetes bacterium DG_61]